MTKYENIKTWRELYYAIWKELNRENYLHETYVPKPGFAVLAEGNDLGEFFITCVSPYDVERMTNAEKADMCGYGYAICSDIDDIRDYARSYFAA